jgi:hypothetical protein
MRASIVASTAQSANDNYQFRTLGVITIIQDLLPTITSVDGTAAFLLRLALDRLESRYHVVVETRRNSNGQ